MLSKGPGRGDELLYLLGAQRPQDYSIKVELKMCNYCHDWQREESQPGFLIYRHLQNSRKKLMILAQDE